MAAGCAGHAFTSSCSVVLCPPESQSDRGIGLAVQLWTFSIVTRFTSSQDLQHNAVVRPLTCSACLTGSMRGLRRQKWHRSSVVLGITTPIPSTTRGVLDCCSSSSSRAWASFPTSTKLPSRMGVLCCLPAGCVIRAGCTQHGGTR
jgi:hypothetical protein